jgi:NADPH:quinone reductase-like Zn-dependent oxidoreductase
MSPANTAAWLTEEKTNPLHIGPADYASPPDDDTVLIRVRALAINPIDWMLQYDAFFPLKYPFVLGQDVAGEVVEVGKDVKGFKKGDRVMAQCTALATSKPNEGGFQEYSQVHKNLVCKIPDSLEFKDAVVVPLGFSTAAIGLYSDDDLKLDIPVATPATEKQASADKGALIIWGAATSVGLNGVQLAARSGYKVYATASPSNFDLVRSLGAAHVFDYSSDSIVDDLKSATSGQTIVGALDCAGKAGSTSSLAEILATSKSEQPGTRLFISSVLPVKEDLPNGVESNFIKGVALRYDDEKSKALWGNYLPKSLADGTYRALPEALIVGHGLGNVQEAMERQKSGVRAQKVVVTIGK